MGLFSFVKNAGAKLFGFKKSEEHAPAANQAEIDAKKAMELEKIVTGLGLDITNLYIRVDGDQATINGTAPNIAEKEKAVLAIGNVEGIATVDDNIDIIDTTPLIFRQGAENEPAQERSIETASVFYTVEKGDSLSKIAKEHYGNAMKYPLIFEANKPMLKDPDLIYPGQVLRIPPLV